MRGDGVIAWRIAHRFDPLDFAVGAFVLAVAGCARTGEDGSVADVGSAADGGMEAEAPPVDEGGAG